MADALGTGLGFTGVLVVLGSIREILGFGSIFDIVIMTEEAFTPWVIMILPPGAFLSLGLMIGIINYFTELRKKRSGI
jgi:electron transport complex protein RnfE